MSYLNKLSDYSPVILRVGLAFVFLWFGWASFANPDMFASLVPVWMAPFGSATMLVRVHGVFELIFGLLLFAGVLTRLSAFFLFLSLIQTITLLSWGPIMVRDIGLALALFSIVVIRK